MVIAFPPGGPTDFVGRLVADKVKDILGRTIIIENKAGANGAIGADYVAKSEPDGTTLFLTTLGAVGVTPHMRNDLPYDSIRDFAPITNVVLNTTLIVVRAESPFKTMKDLVAAAKAKPGEMTFASTGVGSTAASDAGAVAERRRRQVRPCALSRRGTRADRSARRPGPGVRRRRAGADVATSRAARSGRSARRPASAIRCCRMCRRSPSRAMPNVVVDNWYGLLAPAKTPPAIIAKINDAFVKAINDPAVKQKLIDSGAIPVADTPAEFGKFFKTEYDRWGKVVREQGHQGAAS